MIDYELDEALKILSEHQYRGCSQWSVTQMSHYSHGERTSSDISVQADEIHLTAFEAVAIAGALKSGKLSQFTG